MTSENKIDALQLCSLIIMISLSGFLGSGFYCLIKAALNNGYLSIVIGGAIAIIIACLLLYIANYEIELPINEKINKLFGKGIGVILNVILTILVFAIGVFFTYNLNNFISSQFLSETPIAFIAIVFALLLLYVINKGIETLSRVALLILVLNLILYVIAIFGLTPTIELDNFLPFMKDGLSKPLIGSLYFVAINIMPVFLLLIIPKKNIVDENHYNKFVIISIIISIVLIFFIFVVVVGNLGIYLASSYQYPEYIVLKRISLFNFLDRIENMLVIQWIFALCLSICIVVYYISNTIKKKKHNKLINTGIILALLIVSLYSFKNNTIFNEFIYYYFPYVSLTIFIIMLLCGIMIFIKRRRT